MAKLGEYVNIKTGKLDANASSENGKYPFFTCAIEPLKIDTYSYDCECVLVAGNGDLNVKYYSGKFDAYQRTYIIESRDKSKLYVPYMYYFLDKYIETLRKLSIGGVIKYIKLGNLTDSEIPIPELSIQKKIVFNLDKVTHTIDTCNAILEKLDLLVKSRFIEMFNTGEYTTVKLKSVCSKITDGTHKTPNYLPEGITFISAKNIINGELDFSDVKYISETEYNEIQKRCQTEIHDILLSKSGSLGSPTILRTDKPLGLFESLAIIKYDRRIMLPEFLCEQLKTDDIQRQFKIGTKGVAIKHLHLNVIGDIDVVVPPLALQQQFADFVEQTDKSKLAVKQVLEKAETLKKALMQEYFGQEKL